MHCPSFLWISFIMRFLITLLLLVGACSAPRQEESPDSLLRTTTDYLWSQQAEDGGWHSRTHGILKGGKAWTPFVLFYLMQTPDAADHSEDIERAMDFIRTSIGDAGAVGVNDSVVLEYPNYATSYAYRVLLDHGAAEDSILIAKVRTYLLSQQFGKSRGFSPDQPAFGSWGFGETGLPDGIQGHVDLSHTRRVLQAIAEDLPSAAASEAQVFLSLMQKLPTDPRSLPPGNAPSNDNIFDGGFYASSTVFGTNKAGVAKQGEAEYFASYATTTCDGILALLAAGVPKTDDRIVAAADWLRSHPLLDRPEGIPVNTVGSWEKVLFYYHLAVRAEVYKALDWPGDWRNDLFDQLTERQRTDGSFANPFGAPNKEDDPILATAMVVGLLLDVMSPSAD